MIGFRSFLPILGTALAVASCIAVPTPTPRTWPDGTPNGTPICEEIKAIALTGDFDVAIRNLSDCVLVGVTVRLNRKYDCNFVVLNPKVLPDPPVKSMLLSECVDKDGERFNPFITKVVDCKISVRDPRGSRDCLSP